MLLIYILLTVYCCKHAGMVLDGEVIVSNEYDPASQKVVQMPRVFGDALQKAERNGRMQQRSAGEFSMLKVNTASVHLVAEVGSKGPARLW
jgi:hypothetical protein